MFGKSRIKAYVIAAVIAAAAPALSISLPALAEGSRGAEYMIQAAADEVLRETEAVVQEVRRKAADPEGVSVFISSSGKALTREDGKWVTPGEKPESDQEISIVFVGDIIFDTVQNPWSSIAYSDGIRACFDDETWDTLTGADFLVVNNEFPYTDRGTPTPGKTFAFRCPPWTAEWLAEMGTDIAALANNHIYDHGEQGALDTFDTLDEQGIPYIGAGRDIDDASQTAYCIANGTSIAILNATEIERYENPDTREAGEDSPGVFRMLDTSQLCDKIREAKEKADLCIVYAHWGTEKMPSADWSQTTKAEELADAGADLIVGSHPHVLQNIEYVNGVPVFYSLGNYFFGAAARDTGVLRVTVNTQEPAISALQFIPMLQYRGVSTMEGSEKQRVLDEMSSVSPGVAIDEDGYFTEE